MAKPPPPTSTSDPALPTTATTTSSVPKSSSRPSPRPRGLLDPLAASARSLLASARRSPVTTLATAFFLLALVMYGEDARTIAELSIDDYLYPDADLYNVSGLPPLPSPPGPPRSARSLRALPPRLGAPLPEGHDRGVADAVAVVGGRARAASKLSPQAKRKVVTGLASLLPLAS
ncbi:hypothetical protein ZEAMMB73_Zm00001d008558 [Zea mays]|uniref:Uncharacterized protein n=1 Tax=Zea mays TaxID=4577 RepID=A0A1D6FDW3_MAIZE|nr:hypothetical protein ZEAMMB73_Zm00001d008558 [Zea mays]